MKNTNQSQESLNILKVRKLLKKTCIRIDWEIRSTNVTNEEETKIIMRITKRKDILVN